jgi:galactose-1-phosphate uridylyltransferase
MSSEEPKQVESERIPVHTKKPDCLLCKSNKELFGSTMVVCYQEKSASPVAGEQTRRF